MQIGHRTEILKADVSSVSPSIRQNESRNYGLRVVFIVE